MAVHNLGDNVKTGLAIIPSDEGAGAVNGPVIDRLGYEGIVLCCMGGDSTGTHGGESITFKLQEGDESDLSDAADVSGATVALGKGIRTWFKNNKTELYTSIVRKLPI